MEQAFPVLFLAGATVLAGCIGAGDQPLEASSLKLPILGDPLILEHDHEDPALHELSTPNVKLLAHMAWDPVLFDRYPARQYGEIDVEGNIAYVAALWSGFAIVDITDATQPRTLSFTPVLPAYVADIKAASGGDLVILGLQGSAASGARALAPVPGGVPVPVPVPLRTPYLVGLQAWDATDKAEPRLAGHIYVDGGCHMVSVLEQGGEEYAYCAPNDNTVRVFHLARQGQAVVFEPVSIWSPGDLSEVVTYKVSPTRAQFTHDMTAQLDPLTGEAVMFVSFWDLGVHVVDVSDPAEPKLLGKWAGEDATLWGGRIHTAMATLIDGKRVVVTIPEYADIPAVFVLDATDYGAMRLLSEWTAHADGDYGERPALFSTHNFQLVDGKVYLAMYHGGVWVLDIRAPEKPVPLGYFLPAGEPGVGLGLVSSGVVPDTWDVVVANGHMLAVDIPTGLYVLNFEGDPGGDEAYDSFG